MKVYISVDMEGIAGRQPSRTRPSSGHARYPAAVELMVGETNAAIEGALAGGATDILVNDSHGGMYNLLPARTPSGGARPPGPEGVVDGRRAPARTPASTSRCSSATTPGPATRAGRSPTPTPARPVETRLDGRPTGEYGLNALVLGAWGIPVGLVAGDDALAEEVAELAAVGRAGRGQDGGRRQRRGLGPPDRRRGPGPGRRRAGRPAGRGRRAASSCGSARRSSSRSTTGAASRPTTPRSCRAPSASATAASASRPTIRSSRIAASWPATGWPASIDR